MNSATEGAGLRSLLVYLLVLPALILVVLGVLRVRFAVRFWQKMYVVGLVYVAVVVGRLIVQLIW